MSNNYKDVDIIHDYLDGNMDRNTLIKFEQEIANDAELAEEVQWQRDFREAVFLTEKEKLKERAAQLMQKKKNQTSSTSKVVPIQTFWSSQKRYLAIAAMLLLTIAVSLLFFPINEKSLYVKHLEIAYSPSPSDTRTADAVEWLEAYKNKNYTQVATILSQKEQNTSLNTEEKFYLGLAYLYQNQGQNKKAIAYLQQAKSENPILYEENANWFTALAYLKDKQNKAARQILQEIIENKSWKHQDAKQLLEGM